MSPMFKVRGRGVTMLVYFVMVVAGILVFLWVDHLGKQIPMPTGYINERAAGAAATHERLNTLLHVLLAMSVVIVTARAIGALFKFAGQPPVIGEVIAGILLGPSFLGHIAPQVSQTILPESAAPFLGIIAQLGVILYMFLVGLELDLKLIRRSGHATLAISHASIVVPFLLGSVSALWLFPEFTPQGTTFTSFALFLGVSMSVTAFPVLARILADRKVQRSRLGTMALTCAAIDDATAWCLLALVVSVAQAKLGSGLVTFVLTVGYITLMFMVIRPLVARLVPWLETFDRLTEGGMAIIFVALLLSALTTELIGIHAIFGAFLLGAVTPHSSRVAKELTDRLEDLVRVLFLPAFFAFTGMRTQISLLNTSRDWAICGILILVATLGKWGGSTAAARLAGIGWRDAAALGVLMNTRGLVELIVLNIGLDLKVISPTLFAMLVVMALVTTFMTTPVLNALTRRHPWR